MVSMVMVESSQPAHHDVVLDTTVPKPEPVPDPGSLSSPLSDVEPEPEAETLTQDVAQTQKRKGGRKPVRRLPSLAYYSTNRSDLRDVRGT